MGIQLAGPFTVSTGPVNTGIIINPPDTVRVISSGLLNIGYIFPNDRWLDADGWKDTADKNYPAPLLRKYSLVCQLGSDCFQGGTNATFIGIGNSQPLILAPNDDKPSDNQGSWQVVVERQFPDPPRPPGTPALAANFMYALQSLDLGENYDLTQFGVPLVLGKRGAIRVVAAARDRGSNSPAQRPSSLVSAPSPRNSEK